MDQQVIRTDPVYKSIMRNDVNTLMVINKNGLIDAEI
jgi:hypothetical protein